MAGSHGLEAGIGAKSVEAKQEATTQHAAVQVLAFRAAPEVLREAHLMVGFFQDIEQAGHRPASRHLGLERPQIFRLGLGLEGRDRDPAAFSL